MYNDNNQDGSARVRHVPIHIESRSENDRQSPNRGQNQQGRGQNMSQDRFTNTHNMRDYGQASPDTSSIDIEYKPAPSVRNQYSPETSANRQHYNQQQYYDPPRSNHHQYNDHQQQYHYPHQQQQPQEDRHLNDRERHIPSRNISPNSEKLVNSPEPIPLPPPPNSNDQISKASDCTEPDTSSQPKPNEAEQGQGSTEQQHQYQEQHQPVQQTKDTSVMGMINSVKMDLMNLVKEITKFDGTTAKCKEYRYLDEMLTRCMLRLDDIQCGDSAESRQQRKASIKLIDQATDILQRKLQINTDIQNLSESMAISASSGSTNV